MQAAAASSLVLAGFPTTVTAGTAGAFTLTALDPFNNTATGYTGTVSFTSSDGQAALPASYTFVAADNGMHAFSSILKTAGSQSLAATDAGSGINGTQSGITVNVAALSKFLVTGFPSPATAGAATPFIVSASDPFGNLIPDYTGKVNFSTSDAQAIIPSSYTFVAGDNGARAFTATFKTSGNQTLGVQDALIPSLAGSSTIAVNANAATHFSICAPGLRARRFRPDGHRDRA